MVSFARARDLSFDSYSLTSSFSLSSMSFEMVELLNTSYTNKVYFPMPFTILHLGEEEEGDTATSFGFPLLTGAFRRKRRLIIKEEELEENEKGLTIPHPIRLASQAAVRTLVKGSLANGVKGTVHVKVKAKVTFREHSFSIVEHREPYHLDYCRSTVTQAQLDELYTHFKIPQAIKMRVSREDESPRGGREYWDKIPFSVIVLECSVRFPLASFIRMLLSELSLHPFQVSLAL